jgi:hypothetical protein
MKKLFSFILISFILFTNLVAPVSVFAAEPALLTPVGFTQPKDGDLGTSTSSYNFSFTFTAPELPDEVASPNTKYNVFFQPYCDGIVATSGSKYIFNQSKFMTGLVKGNQTFPWNGNVVCPYYAKILRWTLTEIDTTGKVLKTYEDASFKFKLNESYKGYYYVYKDGGGVYSASNVFKDNASCLTDWNSLASKNPSFKIYSECQYLNDIPSVPKTDTSVAVTPKINVAENKSIYKMLVPLPGITCMDSSGQDPNCIPNDIGKYLNFIFKFAIGLCAALAVIMLIIAGVSYMGDESVFGKTEAKKKMFSAILGLIIALGAWALLNTINPDLTGKNGLVIDSASVEIVPLYDRGANDPKQANGESTNCKVVSSGPCSVANLTTIFGADNAVAMSKICSMESGGKENVSSGTDICKPDSVPFSFGLFQVNLLANGSMVSAECANLFNPTPTTCVKGRACPHLLDSANVNSRFECNLLPENKVVYDKCKAMILDTTKNLALAKRLFTPSKQAWSGDKKFCASAFQ